MDEFRSDARYHPLPFDEGAAGLSSFQDQWDGAMDAPVILVVEDDWLLRQDLVDGLAAGGWSVREAESGETALEILRSGVGVDMLVTDVRLGGAVDGWEVADAFRARGAGGPVVYVTGNPVLESRRVGGSVFCTKPCDMAKLLELCEVLLKGR